MRNASRNFRKTLAAVCLLSAGIIALGSCGKKAKNLQELNVLLITNSYGPVLTVVAKEEGFYNNYGLDVKHLIMQGVALDHIAALISRKIDVLTSGGTAALLTMMERGKAANDNANDDMIIIGGIMSEGAALITLPENAAKWTEFTNETLAGKKIGVTRAQSGDVTFRTYLTDNGVDKTKYTMVELGAPPVIMEAVRKGEVDAGIVYVLFRRIAERSGFTIVKHIDELVPAFTCCRIAVRRETLETKRDALVAFLKGQIKAYRVYLTEKEKTVKHAAKYFEIDEAALRDELYDFGHFNVVPDPYKKRVEKFYAGMTDIGYTEGTLDLENHIDVSLYRDALEQVLAEDPNDPVFLELKRINIEYN